MGESGIADTHLGSDRTGWRRMKTTVKPSILAACLLIHAVMGPSLAATGLNESAADEEDENNNNNNNSGGGGGSSSNNNNNNMVNVISVENLDALLGLRMVTELNLKNLTSTTTGERSRRHAAGEHVCRRSECRCNPRLAAASCRFDADEVLDLGSASLSGLSQLDISTAAQVRIHPSAFHPAFSRISIADVPSITIGRDVVVSGTPSLRVLVTNCNFLKFDENALGRVGGDLGVDVAHCGRVELKRLSLSSVRSLRIVNVTDFVVTGHMFHVGGHKAEGDMEFVGVGMFEIPGWSFGLSGARIRFIESRIGVVRREAFAALELESVLFRDTRVEKFENEAFSGRTSITSIEWDNVHVKHVGVQVLSAATSLTIQGSRIDEISDNAFDTVTAFLRLSGNVFRKIGRHAFSIRWWNSIVVDGNEFETLKQDAFAAPFSRVENVTSEFYFLDNVINATEANALSFVPTDDGLWIVIRNNTFREHCHCHLESWMMTLSSQTWKIFYDTSNCRIGEFASCYNIDGEYMIMRNYTEVVCASPVTCEPVRTSSQDAPTELDLRDTERTILGVIFLGVASSVIIMLMILSVSWMRRKGACGYVIARLFDRTDLVASSSISRINIHEYAEVQYQMTDQNKQTILGCGDDGTTVVFEDKATQTLPEELTQELLQSLREKLNDPENYTEARNMIEHLYDLIKVEESCNNNNDVSRTSLLLEEDDEEDDDEKNESERRGGNVYDVIAKRPRKTSRRVRAVPECDMRSVGTRAPSPDKLSPVAFRLPAPARGTAVVAEYAEPLDRKSNEYCELPGSRDGVMPDVLAGGPGSHVYAEPSRRMEDRPLPCRPGTSGHHLDKST